MAQKNGLIILLVFLNIPFLPLAINIFPLHHILAVIWLNLTIAILNCKSCLHLQQISHFQLILKYFLGIIIDFCWWIIHRKWLTVVVVSEGLVVRTWQGDLAAIISNGAAYKYVPRLVPVVVLIQRLSIQATAAILSNLNILQIAFTSTPTPIPFLLPLPFPFLPLPLPAHPLQHFLQILTFLRVPSSCSLV